jgi:hypothetical protein
LRPPRGLPAHHPAAHPQHLTLEGQTGGFLTPTAYVVYADKGKAFSHPAVGFHFINASTVIGNIEIFSITEGFVNRAEAGYSRSIHQLGNETTGLDLSQLWNYSGMNIFHGKIIAIKDGEFGPWTPGIAVGGLIRTNDDFVSGSAYLQSFRRALESPGRPNPTPMGTYMWPSPRPGPKSLFRSF